MKHHTNDYFDFSWDFTNGCSHNCQFCKPLPIQSNFIHCSLHSEPSDWDDFTWMIFLDRISKNSNKKFLITTRFPRKLIGRTYPNNLWIGIACENQESYELRAESLNHIDVRHKFIIFEPLKEEIYLCSDFKRLDWCVIGVDRRKIRLPMDIIITMSDKVKKAKVPLFIRSVFSYTFIKDFGNFPFNLKIREFPNEK